MPGSVLGSCPHWVPLQKPRVNDYLGTTLSLVVWSQMPPMLTSTMPVRQDWKGRNTRSVAIAWESRRLLRGAWSRVRTAFGKPNVTEKHRSSHSLSWQLQPLEFTVTSFLFYPQEDQNTCVLPTLRHYYVTNFNPSLWYPQHLSGPTIPPLTKLLKPWDQNSSITEP